MSLPLSWSLPLILILFSSTANAFFRLGCSLIQTGRVDPIVTPGQVASHVHKIAGASNVNVSSTYDSLRNASCSSCTVQQDKSAYWTPSLYYQHPDSTFQPVGNNGMVVYYLGRGTNHTNNTVHNKIQPFPPGFQMISGDPFARGYNSVKRTFDNKTAVADAILFACLDDAPSKETHNMNRTSCRNGLRAQVHFPACWNGRDLSSPSNSHVAYRSRIDNGECPPSHPVQFMNLFYEVLYSMDSVTTSPGGRFVFSHGDPTGYGFHGDFQNGWDPDVLAAAVRDCSGSGGDGTVESCAPLRASAISDTRLRCPPRPPIVDERVDGALAKLPGCITVTPGPNRAAAADMYCAPSVPRPALNGPPPEDSSPPDNWTLAGCATETSPRALSGASVANSSMTATLCRAFCRDKGFALAGVEYARECFCGAQLSSKSTLFPASNTTTSAGGIDQGNGCNMPCAGSASQTCGGSSRLSLWQAPGYAAPRTVPRVDEYVSRGCWSEGTGGRRALTGPRTADALGMTVASCVRFCKARGFAWAGVEYAAECFCGVGLENGSVRMGEGGEDGGCSMTCKGDAKEWCGGASRLGVYRRE
ncbi:MAG: hypothetical protein M1833_001949 [Piccolia ochrophora]|nr:MAG: hypothetical protein M1833_001949 [Piccolia ochrophora]